MWHITRNPGPSDVSLHPFTNMHEHWGLATSKNVKEQPCPTELRHKILASNDVHPVISKCEFKRRDKELNEIRSRTVQLEKTMRWWSDCAANWRQKWTMIRDQRNQLRSELRTIRKALELAHRHIEQLELNANATSTHPPATCLLHSCSRKYSPTSCGSGVNANRGQLAATVSLGPNDSRATDPEPSFTVLTNRNDATKLSSVRSRSVELLSPCTGCEPAIRWWREQAEFLSRELRCALASNMGVPTKSECLHCTSAVHELSGADCVQTGVNGEYVSCMSSDLSMDESTFPPGVSDDCPTMGYPSHNIRNASPPIVDKPTSSPPNDMKDIRLRYLQNLIAYFCRERDRLIRDHNDTSNHQPWEPSEGETDHGSKTDGSMDSLNRSSVKRWSAAEPSFLSVEQPSQVSHMTAYDTDTEVSQLFVQVTTSDTTVEVDSEAPIANDVFTLQETDDDDDDYDDEYDTLRMMAVSTLERSKLEHGHMMSSKPDAD